MFVFPLVAAAVAGLFSVRCWRAAVKARSVALIVWSFALWQFAIASAALAWGVAVGWSEGLYRVYYLFGAILNVGWLGVGTVWLLAPQLGAQLVTGLVSALSVMAAFDIASVPLRPAAQDALMESVPRGSLVMPPDIRVWSRLFSIGGSAIVLAGLFYSIAARRSRAAGLGLLALGVAIVGAGGELARAGLVIPLSATLAAGIVVMYAGFLKTR